MNKATSTPPMSEKDMVFLASIEKNALSYAVLAACTDLEVKPVLTQYNKPEYVAFTKTIASTHDVGERLRVWAARMAKEKWLPSSEEELQSAINLTALGAFHLVNYMTYYKRHINDPEFHTVKNDISYLESSRDALNRLRDVLIHYKKSLKDKAA